MVSSNPRKWALPRFERTKGSGAKAQNHLLIIHSEDPLGAPTMASLTEALSFCRVGFTILDLASVERLPTLEPYCGLVVLTTLTTDLPDADIERIKCRVHEGCGLVLAVPAADRRLAVFTASTGRGLQEAKPSCLVICRQILAGLEHLDLDLLEWDFDDLRMDLPCDPGDVLAEGCCVLARDEEATALSWTLRYGQGRVIVWNTLLTGLRCLRAMLLETVLRTSPISASALAGCLVIHIDDFPPALSDHPATSIQHEFPDLTANAYFFEVWYPDMIELRQKHGLVYSWYTVIDYADETTTGVLDSASPGAQAAAQVLIERFERSGHFPEGDEIGFHGYNHTPMLEANWPDPVGIRSRLERSRQLWAQHVPAPMPTSWVPTNNQFAAPMLEAIVEYFPTVRTVSTVFDTGRADDGQFRDFGPEPRGSSLLQIPRMTSGYVPTDETRLLCFSQISWMGAWTHFVHPDDLFDQPSDAGHTGFERNPDCRSWRVESAHGFSGMLTVFDAWVGGIREIFPWLEPSTTSQAHDLLEQLADADVSVGLATNRLVIETSKPLLFSIRHPEATKLVAASDVEKEGSYGLALGELTVVKLSAGTHLLEISPV